jgi:exopolysaccharide biosynthesis polyprenyl glycosylphosphotransferase
VFERSSAGSRNLAANKARRDKMAGDQNIQPYFKNSIPMVSSQSLDIAEHERISVGRDHSLGLSVSAGSNSHHSDTDSLQNLSDIVPISQVNGLPKAQRQRRSLLSALHLILMIGDGALLIILIALVLILAPLVHLGSQVPGGAFGVRDTKFVWVCLALIAWYTAANLTHAQNPSDASSPLKSPLSAQCALVMMIIFWAGLLYIFVGGRALSSVWLILLFFVLALPTFSAWRVVLAEVISMPPFRRKAVIVGVNAAGETLVNELKSVRRPGVNILGYISESCKSRREPDGLALLGNGSTLRYMASCGMIDMIIMALDYKANPELYQEAFEASQFGISVVPIALVYESNSGKIPLEHIGDQWSTAIQSEKFMSPLYLCWNRFIDLAFGLCGLVALCLVLPILALLISLDSAGPIFYSQERAGYHGSTFRMLKFRSMSANAEQAPDGQWTTEHDPRVTRIGRFMRATHLDELPQALNILQGDMSLIGPRPERPAYMAGLAKENIFYSYRLSVKPGLTGWAQVKYGYGSGEQDELVKLQYDLYYIKHRSFLLDILIILKTVLEVVLRHGI